ncbi:unnamed protein product, partial [Arabidopsis halleri]
SWVWLLAGLVFVAAILLIFMMVAILVIRPKFPDFNIHNAELSSFNLDLDLKKIKLRSENGAAQVFFNNHLISKQFVEPFNVTTQEKKLETLTFISNVMRLSACKRQCVASSTASASEQQA